MKDLYHDVIKEVMISAMQGTNGKTFPLPPTPPTPRERWWISPRHPYTPLPPTPPTPRERWWIKTIIFVLSSPPSSFLGSGGGERTKV
jgi:hypothetical protein